MKSQPLTQGTWILLVILLLSCSGPARLTQHDFDLNNCKVLAEKQKVIPTKRNPKVRGYTGSAYPKIKRTPPSSSNDLPLSFAAERTPIDVNFGDEQNKHFPAKASTSDLYENTDNESSESAIVELSSFSSDASEETIAPREAATHQSFSPTPNADAMEIFGAMALVAALSIIGFRMFSSRLIKISAWCAHHPKSTKAILAGLHTVAGLSAFAMGEMIAAEGQLFGSSVIGVAAATATLSALAYPQKSFTLGRFTNGYLRHKACDTMLFVSGAAMMAAAGNHSYASWNHGFVYTVSSEKYRPAESLRPTEFAHYVSEDQSTADPEPKKNRGARKAAVIFGFVALTLAVSAASCAIACSGQGVLAAVFFVGFETLLILWLVHALRKIDGKLPKKKRVTPAVEVG